MGPELAGAITHFHLKYDITGLSNILKYTHVTFITIVKSEEKARKRDEMERMRRRIVNILQAIERLPLWSHTCKLEKL